MENQIDLSVIVPCYNEEKRLHKILEAIIEYQKNAKITMEIIIVLDGTPDNTLDTANKFKQHIHNLIVIDRKENHGKGYSVREGMLMAKGKYCLFADADNSTPFVQIDKLMDCMTKYDVAIGSRYISGGGQKKKQSLVRIIGSRVLNMIIQLLAVRGIKDTQCGFKLFSRKAVNEIFPKQTIEKWSFDIELLAIARYLGLNIVEVPIVWYDDPHSTVNPIKDGLKMVVASWQIRKNVLMGRYK